MTVSATGSIATSDPRVPIAAPAAVALAWMVLVAVHASGHGGALDHDALLGDRGLSLTSLAIYAAVWIVMITAMMLPSAVPLVRLFATVSAAQDRAGVVVGVFVGGYLAVWATFGWLALGLDGVVHALVDAAPWLDEHPELIAASLLALAGAFQLSSLKDRCLRTCRHPAAYLLSQYRRGPLEAFRVGWNHGLFCLGCCWALMFVAFAAGMTDLRWMAAFTALMTYEKVGRHGEAVARSAGLVLLGVSAAVAAGTISQVW